MAAAARLGISHAEFLGWPHEQRAIMIANFRVERNTGRYGEWLPDAVSPWGEAHAGSQYTPAGPFVNVAEKTALDAEQVWKKSAGETTNTNGMFWTVETLD